MYAENLEEARLLVIGGQGFLLVEGVKQAGNFGSSILTDKLTNFFSKKQEDIRPFFESQLEACGVDYFDIYLMHAQGADNFAYFL